MGRGAGGELLLVVSCMEDNNWAWEWTGEERGAKRIFLIVQSYKQEMQFCRRIKLNYSCMFTLLH